MELGRVVQFNQDRGFGFIAPDNGGEDVFVHVEELTSYGDRLRVGTRVSFESMEGQRGLKAYDVKVLDETPRQGASGAGGDRQDDELSDVIPAHEYSREITDALVTHCPEVTAGQIREVRQALVVAARNRGWLEG